MIRLAVCFGSFGNLFLRLQGGGVVVFDKGMKNVAIFFLVSAAFFSFEALGGSPVKVDFTKQSDWGAGLVAEIKMRNDSADAVKDWRLKFRLDAEIDG
ncbi:MAG: cellulose binding domain-containing protein, partial [Chthoniobacterales bacterium]